LPSPQARYRIGLFVTGLAAFASRMSWILLVHSKPVSDFAWYDDAAISLSKGLGYITHGHPTAFRPPGYPLFLSVLHSLAGPSLFAPKLANVILWTASAMLAFVLGSRFAGVGAGLLSGLIVALLPDFVFISSLTASENLFVAILYAAATILILSLSATGRRRTLAIALSGLLLGAAILTRATAVWVPVPLAALLLLPALGEEKPARRVAQCALLLGCAVLVVMPWIGRNMLVMGQPVLATEGGVTLWIGNHHGATGTYESPPRNLHTNENTAQGELASDKRFTALALRFISERPGEWLSLVPKKAWLLFGPQSFLTWALSEPSGTVDGRHSRLRQLSSFESVLWRQRRLVSSVTYWMQLLYWLAGVAGLSLAAARRRPEALVILVAAVCWVAFDVTVGIGQPRQLVGIAPLLAPGIAYLAVASARAARGRGARAKSSQDAAGTRRDGFPQSDAYGGGACGSNTPRRLFTPHDGFEDREAHQDPSASRH
jgi:4-amino-4-deoxy-L-arabinose transferase-like glycosyltransferase